MSVRALAKRYGVSPTTVQKWRGATTSTDARMGPKEPRSTVLRVEEEAMIVAFRRHTLLPLDDCLYGLQPTIPHLTRSSLHRCLERHGISRLPEMDGDKPKTKFAAYAIGYFHIDIAEVRTEEGKLYLFVAIDRTSKFAFASCTRRPIDTSPRLPARPDRGCALQHPHRPDRQRQAVLPRPATQIGQPPTEIDQARNSPAMFDCVCASTTSSIA